MSRTTRRALIASAAVLSATALELFRAPHYEDVSLAQWMVLTPHELVAAHLEVDRQFLDQLRKDKQPIV